jgi:hypothetical protein
MRAIARNIDSHHLEYTCLLGFAGIALEHGRSRPGLNALRRGFALGREYGYSHFQWWLPEDMGRLCAHAIRAGIEPDYARDLARRRGLSPGPGAPAPENWPWEFRICTLGGFRLLCRGEPPAASGKAQRRPLELLKVLIAYGGEGVAEARIADAIWPRIPGDSAHRSFTSTLHRLRKLLGEDKALILHEGKLSFDRRYVWTDAWAFEAEADALEAALRAGGGEAVAAAAERLLALYRGPFLAGEADEAWMLERRERLRARLARLLAAAGRVWDGAPALVARLRELDPEAG